MVKKSEFGRGLAICLVKFAEHFENDMARIIGHVRFFYEDLKGDEGRLAEYGRDVRGAVAYFKAVYAHVGVEKGMSHLIETWANGATDHLYDIEVPGSMARTKMGRLVGRLQSKGLRIGHGFTGETWTCADFAELRELTRRIALELDRRIGLKPDMGKW